MQYSDPESLKRDIGPPKPEPITIPEPESPPPEPEGTLSPVKAPPPKAKETVDLAKQFSERLKDVLKFTAVLPEIRRKDLQEKMEQYGKQVGELVPIQYLQHATSSDALVKIEKTKLFASTQRFFSEQSCHFHTFFPVVCFCATLYNGNTLTQSTYPHGGSSSNSKLLLLPVNTVIDHQKDKLYVVQFRKTKGGKVHVDLIVVKPSTPEVLINWCATNLLELDWKKNGFLECSDNGKFKSNNLSNEFNLVYVDVFIAADVKLENYRVQDCRKQKTSSDVKDFLDSVMNIQDF
jgi:hypothetical protein